MYDNQGFTIIKLIKKCTGFFSESRAVVSMCLLFLIGYYWLCVIEEVIDGRTERIVTKCTFV